MKWKCADNTRTLDQIYDNFRDIIAINADLCFMTSFEYNNVTYLASPNNFDQYPDELLKSIKEFYLWQLNLGK